jgi:heavy metal translocating P-type ATPase
MLLESSEQKDPAKFRETDLFKKCLGMGIIPGSETELDAKGRPPGESTAPGQNTLSLNLKVAHMWCPACAWVIAEVLKQDRGILDAHCSFSTDSVRCSYDPTRTSPDQIMGIIDHLGYKAVYPDTADSQREMGREFVRFGISAFLTLNVMMLSFGLYSGFFTELSGETVSKLSWPAAILAGVVLFYGGHGIYTRALQGLSHAAFGMEALITAGAFSAYLYSTYNLLFVGGLHLYYDTASILVTLVLLGKALEGRARRSVQQDLENLFSLRPAKVKICTASYPRGRYVDARQLSRGDLFLVQEGEILAADGIVLEGTGSADESTLTGESRPVEKKPGDRLRAGTRVMQGEFRIGAERVGDESIFGQMIRTMEDALGSKARFEEKADVVLQWFVPLILFLALGTCIVCLALGLSLEDALVRAVTVMVIACPCTFGVAVPLARVAGISLMGKRGILIRHFPSFEQAGKIDHFVFDKTGTVTMGNWELLKIVTYQDFEEEQALGLAASLEKGSNHYIAMQIKGRAGQLSIPPVALEDIQTSENGIAGHLGDSVVKIGSREFLAREWEGGPVSENRSEAEPLHSRIYMSFGGKPCALFLFGDRIKEGARETVEQLERMGLGVSLVSGDGKETTLAVAGMIGVTSAFGGKMPREKADYVEELQAAGRQVAMVGDGINDAPALAQSDLAIAMYSGNALNSETSDITLMRGEPRQIHDFLGLAKRVSTKIRQNLFFAFFYNAISIPIAMSGLLTPLIAVSAMLLSSLSVTLNTLMLMKEKEGNA